MTTQEFKFWLQGFFEGVSMKDKDITQVLFTISKKAEEIQNIQKEKVEIEVEKIIVKEIPKWPEIQQPFVVMYGVQQTPFTPIDWQQIYKASTDE